MRKRDGGAGTVPRKVVALLVAVAMLAGAASIGALGGVADGAGGGTCHAPLLEGLTYKLARVLAERAGCGIRLKGNPLTRARVQVIVRQSPAAGAVTSTVPVWLDRACRKGVSNVPEIHEPEIT